MSDIMKWALLTGAFVYGAVQATFLARRFPLAGRWIVFAHALVLGVALDLVSKEVAFAHLPYPGASEPLNEWFAFTHARNEGAAFGLFQGEHTFFMCVTLLAFVGVPYFIHAARKRVLATATVLGFILAGVIGNFWDRMVFGYVRDFLDVHTPPAGTAHDLFQKITGKTIWPTFNVADMFITGGAFVIFLLLGREDAEARAEAAAPEGDGAAGADAEETDASPADGVGADFDRDAKAPPEEARVAPAGAEEPA